MKRVEVDVEDQSDLKNYPGKYLISHFFFQGAGQEEALVAGLKKSCKWSFGGRQTFTKGINSWRPETKIHNTNRKSEDCEYCLDGKV